MRVFRKLQMKSNALFERTEKCLFNGTSIGRSIVLTVSMIALYFVSYLVISKVYYSVAVQHSYILMPRRYFPVFFCIAMLPIFGFIFLKLNIWTTFWKNTERPHLVDYLFFFVILLFIYVSFNHGDLCATSVHGKAFLDMIWRRMNILDFYDYNKGQAVYLLPQYILFGIWSIPVKIGYMLAGLPPIGVNETSRINGLTLWWYKLLPTLFYFGSAYLIYKIGILLQMEKNKAKWMAFVFFTFPMASFSQFIFGQYDSIGVFFELIMVYFFLQKKPMKASLLCMVAMTFKIFPIFIFLPLLLLIEKKVFKIIGYTIIAVSGYLLFNLPFQGSEMFMLSKQFNTGMFQRLFYSGIGTQMFGTLSFFILIIAGIIVIAWFTNIKDKDDFTYFKYILFIPLCVYSTFFSLVLFHPQWILVLVPYLVMNIFMNKNTKGFVFISIAASVAFLFKTMSFWTGNVDANMLNMGGFPLIFGFNNNYGETFRSMLPLATIDGLIHPSLYFSLFVGMLLINVILSFPTIKNIQVSKTILSGTFSVERDIVWVNGLLVLIFAVSSILVFFTIDPIREYRLGNYSIISEITMSKDTERIRQNVNDIDTVDIIDNNIVLKCGTHDPSFYIPLQSGIEKPAGSPFVEITYANSRAGGIQIYYDYGDGLSEGQSIISSIKTSNDEEKILLRAVRWKGKKQLVGFRIDPPDGTEFVIKSIRILSIE